MLAQFWIALEQVWKTPTTCPSGQILPLDLILPIGGLLLSLRGRL